MLLFIFYTPALLTLTVIVCFLLFAFIYKLFQLPLLPLKQSTANIFNSNVNSFVWLLQYNLLLFVHLFALFFFLLHSLVLFRFRFFFFFIQNTCNVLLIHVTLFTFIFCVVIHSLVVPFLLLTTLNHQLRK